MIQEEFPRSFSIDIPGKLSINTPFFFPAISTIKTNFSPGDYLDLIIRVAYPGFLISSYDIHKTKGKEKKFLIDLLSKCEKNQIITLLDNGNYEAYWYRKSNWLLDNLESVLNEISVDFCFSFDVFWGNSQNINQYIKKTLTSISKTAGMQKSGTTIPIIHSNPKLFPRIIHKIVDSINPEIIAIPERELGSSILERAQTIKRIREEINKTKMSIPLHLLGTGNPISILIYTLCGADIYDGLEWCTTVVNPKTGYLSHFTYLDLIDCKCRACRTKIVPYHIKAITHNLIFFINFLEKIKKAIQNENATHLLNEYIPKKNVPQIKKIIALK